MQREHREPLVVPVGSGTTWHVLGETITQKVPSATTAGAYAVIEEVTPPHGGPPLHCHQHEDELFYVLEGHLELQCGDRRFTADPGTLVVLPRNTPHTFRNGGTTPSKVLVVVTPGGFEQFFAAVAAADAPSLETVVHLAAQHGLAIVGPPLSAEHGGRNA